MSNDIKLGPHLLLCDSNSIITVSFKNPPKLLNIISIALPNRY